MSDNIHFIKDKKFKKNIIKINFVRPALKEEITKLNFLTHILLLSSKKYQSEREIIYKTKELYDLSMEAFVSIYGKCSILSFKFVFLKDEFTEEGNSGKIIDFIKELIYNPNVKNGKFDKRSFELAKSEVVDEIKTYRENKNTYSRIKMLQYMDPASPAAIELVGNMEDLEKITPENLYQFYLDVFSNSVIDAFVFGNLKNKLSFLQGKQFSKRMDYIYSAATREPKVYIERDQINQSKLVIGYNLVDLTPVEAQYALQIYLYLLGLGPSSKLFANVREKESLCYSIGVTAKYVNSLMMITAGIDAVNFDKTTELIAKQITDMSNGNFKSKDIEAAKLSLKSTYQELLESPHSIINSYEASYYLNYDSIKNRIKKIELVTKDDIIKVAKKIKLNTIYLLEGKRK